MTPRPELRPLFGFMLAAGLTLVFILLASEVTEGEVGQFDALMFRLLRRPDEPAWLTEMARDVTALGSFAVLGIILAVAAAGQFLAGRNHAACLTLAAVLGGTALSTALKMGFDRPRPDLTGVPMVFTASFPSGHAMLTAVTFLTLAALLSRITTQRRLRIFIMGSAITLTILVGLTRIHLGVHYATDVLAGWCTGSAWGLLCWNLSLWLQRRGRVEAPAG